MHYRSSGKIIKRTAIAASLALALPMAAQAQNLLEEVIVTAQKREQNLQDVPIAVSAFSGALLKESGIKDVYDLQTSAPSLIVDQSQSATNSSFSIRGIGSSSQNFGFESSVGLYIDGVYRARQSSMINQLVDIASVDILRGPQGTLFGRNTLSGAVQFTTVRPDHEGTGFLEVTAGNFGLLNLSGAASISAIEDVLAFRVTGFSSERDGFIDNLTTSGDDEIVDRDRYGFRLQGLWTPSDTVSVIAIADYAEVDEICCANTVKDDNLLIDKRVGTPTFGNLGTDSILEPRGATYIPSSRIFDQIVAYSFNPISESEDMGLSVQVDWDFADEYTLTSITAWRDFSSFDHIDAEFTDLDALEDTNDAEQSQLSQEFRVTFTGDKLNWVAGAYYFEQDLDSISTLTFGEDTDALASAFSGVDLGAIPGGFLPADGWASDLNKQEHESWAIFGQGDYMLTDTLTLTAGLRYSDEEKLLITEYTESGSEFGFVSGLFPPVTPRDNVDETITDEQVTGTVKLSWFATETMMVYASYGTGYKAGGTNTDRIKPEQDQLFDAETSTSYEIGLKADFPEQGLRVNVAVYQADIEDLQVATFTGDGFNVKNAADAETYGAEIEVFWQPVDSFNMTAAYAKNVADFEEFELGNCWFASPFRGTPDPGASVYIDPANPEGGTRPAETVNEQFDPDVCDRTGDRLGTNPEDFFAASAYKEWDLSSSTLLWIKGEYTYTGDMMLDQSNDPYSYQGSYDIWNLRTGLIFIDWGLEITAWGRNIFDEEYTSTSAPGTLQDGKQVAYVREPATYGITIRKDF